MNNTIILPNIKIHYDFPIPKQDLILIGGGRTPTPDWLIHTSSTIRKRSIWCIDHGLDACRAAGLTPERLIGDGDSAIHENWKWAEKLNIPIEKFNPEKDLTDTQLALSRVQALETVPYVILTGSMGGRFDHLFSTVFSFAHSSITGCMSDDLETIIFLKNEQGAEFNTIHRPKAISLLPITDCEGVDIEQVYWPLHNVSLQQSNPYAVSNELVNSDSFTVRVKQGILAVYICWSEKN